MRNIAHKARDTFDATKHTMDQHTGPDLSYLFEKPAPLPSKPTLAPQREIPRLIPTEPAKPSVKSKFQHERLMHPWQREFERIKKEEAAAELDEHTGLRSSPHRLVTSLGDSKLVNSTTQAVNNDENGDSDDDDDDEGIGWSPFLVPVDV